MTKIILRALIILIFCWWLVSGCSPRQPALIYPRGKMVELADSTGNNYILETSDSPNRICQYFKKVMGKIDWKLERETPSAGGTTTFTTPLGVEMNVDNTLSRVLLFTDYRNLKEVRVLTDSVSHNSVIVVSSNVMEASSKCGVRTTKP
jgi:hypothetical protein